MERLIFPHPLHRALALFFAALLCGCEDGSKAPRDAAEKMSRLLIERRISEAYRQASSAFRFTRSENYFEARVRDLGLCDATGVKWGADERHGRLATVHGVFTLKDGGELPLSFTFSMEDGAWRLIEASSEPLPGRGGAGEDIFAVALRTRDTMEAKAMEILEPSAAVVPDGEALRQLAEDTLLLFSEAIRNGGDFSALYASASDRWKYRGRDPRDLAYSGPDPGRLARADPENADNRLTIEALRNAFSVAIEAKVDLSPIKGRKMILSAPPRVTSDGVLSVNGTFDAPVYQANMEGQPRKLVFALEYVREAATWKLFGITVNVIAMNKGPVSER
jgi:hypothetical protein